MAQDCFIWSVDLGKETDYTGLVINKVLGETPSEYKCLWIERFQLHTPYQVVAQNIAEMWSNKMFKGSDMHLLLDITGVGSAVWEMFKCYDIWTSIGICITAGLDVTRRSPVEYRVPKKDLALGMNMVLDGGRLSVSPHLEYAKTLEKEMMAFRIKIKQKSAAYEADKVTDHDDLVLAQAMALWYGEHELIRMPEDNRPMPEARPLGMIGALARSN